ncbi:DUF885 domain-containing protein [soil metagenome]
MTPNQPPETNRAATAVDAVAERYLTELAALDPISATYLGLPGHDGELPDLSPDGLAAMDALADRTLQELQRQSAADDVDRVTLLAMNERLALQRELHQASADAADLKNIASPLQTVRDIFDLMPTATVADWSTIATRLAAIPTALQCYQASLRQAATRGEVAAKRQVRAGISQCQDNLGATGFFAGYVAGAATATGTELPAALAADLDRAALAAQDGYAELSRFLGEELLERAPEADPVGMERYQLFSRQFLGATIDLAETYAWGIGELARISALMADTAHRILPGASVGEAIAHLDRDPSQLLSGTAALQAWMQRTSDEAIEALADVHFDIPAPLRTLECRIAPTHVGAIYYTGPSDDFSRPGRMWWSVPDGITQFGTWRELTTVYHEGVPGHHLQVAQTVYRRNLLNSWRRLAAGTSGHAEGWALYAEWLMSDLGFMDDPASLLGMLDGQSLRAARVVIDIGVHCGFTAPDEVGGGDWTYDKAWQLLSTHAHMAEGFLRFELDRYLGWPGQAPSYKVGERVWLQLRDETRAREGAAFDLKAFHRRALDIGGVGLDVLAKAVLGEL